MRDQDRPVERGEDVGRDALEARGPRERRCVEAVHVRRPADALARVDAAC